MGSGIGGGEGREAPLCAGPPVLDAAPRWDVAGLGEDHWPPDLDPDSSGPPELDDVPVRVLMEDVDAAARARRAKTAAGEVLTAGFWSRNPSDLDAPGSDTSRSPGGSGFTSGGMLDVLEPGVPLAGFTDAATRSGGLGGLDDDELIGVIRAWRRLESWSTAGTLTAIAELGACQIFCVS